MYFLSASHLGDATGETAGWYSDYTGFVNFSLPWFARGGHHKMPDDDGIFNFGCSDGEANNSYSFRTVLSVTN